MATQSSILAPPPKKRGAQRNMGFPGGSEVKESASNVEDPGSIPGLGRSPGEEMVTHSGILAWRIPWMEKPGRLQSMGLQRVGRD